VKTWVVIPARGGSKAIPNKNLSQVGSHSLLARAVGTSLDAGVFTRVLVSTDDRRIAEEARRCGAEVVTRPSSLAGDLASSESAVLHAVDSQARSVGEQPDAVVLVQCTSPFLRPEDLRSVYEHIGRYDSVFTAVEDYAFRWTPTGEGEVRPHQHDPTSPRMMRQQLSPMLRESGGAYGMLLHGLQLSGSRFFGRVGVVLVPESRSLEIDTQEDLMMAQWLASYLDSTRP